MVFTLVGMGAAAVLWRGGRSVAVASTRLASVGSLGRIAAGRRGGRAGRTRPRPTSCRPSILTAGSRRPSAAADRILGCGGRGPDHAPLACRRFKSTGGVRVPAGAGGRTSVVADTGAGPVSPRRAGPLVVICDLAVRGVDRGARRGAAQPVIDRSPRLIGSASPSAGSSRRRGGRSRSTAQGRWLWAGESVAASARTRSERLGQRPRRDASEGRFLCRAPESRQPSVVPLRFRADTASNSAMVTLRWSGIRA